MIATLPERDLPRLRKENAIYKHSGKRHTAAPPFLSVEWHFLAVNAPPKTWVALLYTADNPGFW